jgi:hypothetical protein
MWWVSVVPACTAKAPTEWFMILSPQEVVGENYIWNVDILPELHAK